MNVRVLHIEAIEVCPSKRCTACGVFRLREGFREDRRNRGRLRGSCKQCQNKAAKAYREANPEQVQEATRRWKKSNPEKVRETARKWLKANPEQVRQTAKEWNQANPGRKAESTRRWHIKHSERLHEKRWAVHIKAKYGLSVSQYYALVITQSNLCAICGQPETVKTKGKVRRLAVDHDHKTGVVRALLCSACNQGIGKLRDDPELLRAAADYLLKHRKKDIT